MILYSSDNKDGEILEWSAADANSYRPFKILDAALVRNITEQLDSLEPTEEEGIDIINFPGSAT